MKLNHFKLRVYFFVTIFQSSSLTMVHKFSVFFFLVTYTIEFQHMDTNWFLYRLGFKP